MKEDFYWGVATSAPQSEGAAFLEGKGASIWDTFSAGRNKIAGRHTPQVSNDFYHRYAEDIGLMKSLHIPNFRFSIAWPRVLPEGTGAVNHKGLDFYDRLTDHCLANNITPWATLYHWDLPQVLEDKGGWTNRDIVKWFSDYIHVMLSKLGDRIQHWMVLNEPLVFTGAGYFLGVHAPGRRGMDNFLAATHHAALAQATGIKIIKQFHSALQAGTTFSCSMTSPYSDGLKDKGAAERADALLNRLFIEPLLGYGYPVKELPFLNRIEKYFKKDDEALLVASPDFIGIQNYTREVIKHSWMTPYLKAKPIDPRSRRVNHTMMNWEIYPEGIYHILKQFNQYKEVNAIIVTENGAAFPDKVINGEVDDVPRITYLKSYIEQVLKAKNEGVKVKGYFLWSFTDNFEWAEGYFPRFGIVYIDYEKQQRIVKKSGKWFSQMIQQMNLSAKAFEEKY